MIGRTVKSGDLFSFVTSGSRGWAKYYRDSGPAFLRVGNLDHDSVSLDLRDVQRVQPPSGTEGTRTKVQPSDILISITADVGMVGIVPEGFEEAYINQHVALARPTSDVHPPYLAWCLSSPPAQQQFRELQRGATKVGLGLDDIRAVDIPLPPLPEQRHIVAEIEKQFTRLDVGLAALRRVQANLKRYRAAVLKAACEGHLVPTEAELAKTGNRKSPFESGEALLAHVLTDRRKNWEGRGQYKEAPQPEVVGLAKLPDGWIWSSLAQLSAHITDGTHKTPTYVQSGVPFLSAKDIAGFKLSFDECRYIPKAEHAELSVRCAVHRGNVLITKSGTIGRVAVVDTDQVFSLFESVANVPVTPPINPKFVAFAAYVSIAGVFGAANQKGVAVRHLHLEDLRRVPIPLPPLAEQTRIVAEVERRLSVVEELESVVAANLQRAARLRQSILQKAFTGQLLRSSSGLSKGAQT